MARIRTVKPEFYTHEVLSAMHPEIHLLAGGLLNYADDEGYFNANPALVKAAIFPVRECSVSIHDGLSELSRIGYCEFMDGSDGRRYGRIVKFTEHQRINRPSHSKIKALVAVTEQSVSPHARRTDDSLAEWKGREQGTGKWNGSDDDALAFDSGQFIEEILELHPKSELGHRAKASVIAAADDERQRQNITARAALEYLLARTRAYASAVANWPDGAAWSIGATRFFTERIYRQSDATWQRRGGSGNGKSPEAITPAKVLPRALYSDQDDEVSRAN